MSDPTTAVRAAGPGDVPAVLALWARARSANASTPDTPEALGRLLDDDPGALLVADAGADGGPIAGAVIAAWDGWRGNMYRLAVDPAHRRRGVARALVRAGEERLARRGARRITALVAHEESEAVGLWEAAGYVRDATIARFVRTLS
jgi:ribosomal protein S18 acetylase RimI-like enzyme